MTRLTYVGHATVLVETAGMRLLTDPVLRGRVAHLRRIAPLRPVGGLLTPDAVLISHAHMDHLDLPSLRRLGPSTRIIVPRGLARLAERAGLRDVTEVSAGERVRLGAAGVLATHAEHDGRRLPWGPSTEPLGYVVEGPERVYFAGDTDIFEGMRDLAVDLDVALLPVAGWGRTLPPGHLDPERAARAVALLEPRFAVPIHWGTYAGPGVRSRDPQRPAVEFARLTASHAPDVEVRILDPGEEMTV